MVRRVRLCALGVIAGAMLAGCSSAPKIEESPWTGPRARLRSGDRSWVAVFTAPTGGWGVELDKVEPQFEAAQVFVTLRRPDPSRSVTQALVDLSVDTSVRPALSVEVYARTLEAKGGDKDAPYAIAARSVPEGTMGAKSSTGEQSASERPSSVGP